MNELFETEKKYLRILTRRLYVCDWKKKKERKCVLKRSMRHYAKYEKDHCYEVMKLWKWIKMMTDFPNPSTLSHKYWNMHVQKLLQIRNFWFLEISGRMDVHSYEWQRDIGREKERVTERKQKLKNEICFYQKVKKWRDTNCTFSAILIPRSKQLIIYLMSDSEHL